jgi:Ca2+/Na+ antiporter
MLTLGIIAIINPIVIPSIASPLTAGVFVAIAAIFMYLRSRDGVINKKDAMLMIGLYLLFVLTQYLFQLP